MAKNLIIRTSETTCKNAVQKLMCPEWVDEIARAPFQFSVQIAYAQMHSAELEKLIADSKSKIARLLSMDVDDIDVPMLMEQYHRVSNAKEGTTLELKETIELFWSLVDEKARYDKEYKDNKSAVTKLASGLVFALGLTKVKVKVPEWFHSVYGLIIAVAKLRDEGQPDADTEKACREAILKAWNYMLSDWNRKPLQKLTAKGYEDTVNIAVPQIKSVLSKTDSKTGKTSYAGFKREYPKEAECFKRVMASLLFHNGFAVPSNEKNNKELNLF